VLFEPSFPEGSFFSSSRIPHCPPPPPARP